MQRRKIGVIGRAATLALLAFVLDQIGFVECKLNEAVRDAASQLSAITEASGVVPQLRERMVSENKTRPSNAYKLVPNYLTSMLWIGGIGWP